MVNSVGATIKISKYVSVHRGFTILVCPQHSKTKRRAYQITSNGFYLGREFSSVDAEKTIDEIIRKAKKCKKHTQSSLMICFSNTNTKKKI